MRINTKLLVTALAFSVLSLAGCSGPSAAPQSDPPPRDGEPNDPPTDPPDYSGAAQAGAAVIDASWHLGASAGQFSGSGHGIDNGRGYDPYSHSTRKVGSDTLGTRIEVRALVVDGANGKRVGVVANDLYLPNDFTRRRVVQLLQEHDVLAELNGEAVTGLNGNNLAMTVSHSHTSPFYSTPAIGPWIFQDVFDVRFYDYMAQQMAQALIDASTQMRPVQMGATAVYANDVRGHTIGPKVSDEHRTPNTPAGQPHDYTTRQMYVVRFDNLEDGSNYANWIVHGVHPEWVWGEEIVNGDLTHATMRILDRETGAITIMSQSETGASGPHKDERAHRGFERREFQESSFAGADRAARLVADNVKRALSSIVGDRPVWDEDQHAAVSHDFAVDYAFQRFAPPGARPVPTASNCNADSIYYDGNPDVPVPELPECERPQEAITEPFQENLPIWTSDVTAPLADALMEQGVPLPHSYSIPAYALLEEGATVPIQAFKLGDVAVTFCPCEQFTDPALNVISRLNRVSGDIHTGWDWSEGYQQNDGDLEPGTAGYSAWKRNPATHGDYEHAGGYDIHHTGDLAQQRFDVGCEASGDEVVCEHPSPQSGDYLTMTKVAFERMRAQIHNDAAGWDELSESINSEAEPLDVTEIKGNFTHEEFPERGYGLVIPVGMANDYWGYMPAYREYRAYDHYRKSLAGLGPHGADFLATRMARLADQLQGGDGIASNVKDQLYMAEDARQELFARVIGDAGRALNAVYPVTLPADGGEPRITVAPSTVERFDAAVVKWIGGNTFLGMPTVSVERFHNGEWQPYGDQMGDVQLRVRFPGGLGLNDMPGIGDGLGDIVITAPLSEELALWRVGQFEWEWTAAFEVFVSDTALPTATGDVITATPVGQYRFVISGERQTWGGSLEPYALTAEFDVLPWSGISVVPESVASANGVTSFSLGPVTEHAVMQSGASQTNIIDTSEYTHNTVSGIDYPDTWKSVREGGVGAIPWLRNIRNLHRYGSGDEDDEQYCHRCTFRPWLDTGKAVSVLVETATGLQQLASTENGVDYSVPSSAVRIPANGIKDAAGNTNGQCIPLVAGGCGG